MKRCLSLLPLLAVACSGYQDPDDLNAGEPMSPYTLSVDKSLIESDGKDVATFTITDANGMELTGEEHIRNTSFHIEETDEWRSGIGADAAPNHFSSIEDGTFTFSAMYKGEECVNKVTVKSQNRSKYEVFHKNVAIYRLTGTWCQYCPYMTEALSNIDAYTKDHSIVMEFHNADEYSVPYSSTMDIASFILSRFGTKDDGYPYCVYSISEGSGKRTVNDIQRLVRDRLFEDAARTGIKASSVVNDARLTVKAAVKASVAGKYDLGMAVLKDNCIPTSDAQEEVYNDVVMSISGNFYAMSSDGSFSLDAGAEKDIEKVWESDVLESSADDCRVVLFTLTERDGKVIIDNAVGFKVGEGVDYRYN